MRASTQDTERVATMRNTIRHYSDWRIARELKIALDLISSEIGSSEVVVDWVRVLDEEHHQRLCR